MGLSIQRGKGLPTNHRLRFQEHVAQLQHLKFSIHAGLFIFWAFLARFFTLEKVEKFGLNLGRNPLGVCL